MHVYMHAHIQIRGVYICMYTSITAAIVPRFSASLVAVSMLTVPVIAAILARFLFAEQLTLLNWAAFGVVLLGIYLAVSDS